MTLTLSFTIRIVSIFLDKMLNAINTITLVFFEFREISSPIITDQSISKLYYPYTSIIAFGQIRAVEELELVTDYGLALVIMKEGVYRHLTN